MRVFSAAPKTTSSRVINLVLAALRFFTDAQVLRLLDNGQILRCRLSAKAISVGKPDDALQATLPERPRYDFSRYIRLPNIKRLPDMPCANILLDVILSGAYYQKAMGK